VAGKGRYRGSGPLHRADFRNCCLTAIFRPPQFFRPNLFATDPVFELRPGRCDEKLQGSPGGLTNRRSNLSGDEAERNRDIDRLLFTQECRRRTIRLRAEPWLHSVDTHGVRFRTGPRPPYRALRAKLSDSLHKADHVVDSYPAGGRLLFQVIDAFSVFQLSQ
jgi:hypothetical protein